MGPTHAMLAGKVALVTGAAGSVGHVISRHLVEAGANVIGSDIAWTKEATEKAKSIGLKETIVLDQRSSESVTKVADDISGRYPDLEALINCAAFIKKVPYESLHDLNPDLWDEIFETNLRGPFLLARSFAGMLNAGRGGHIVNISSIGGSAPVGSSIAYSVAKAGLNHLTKCLAIAMAPNIAVNCIAPGIIENSNVASRLMSDSARARARSKSPLGRLAELDDIARQVITFLMSTSQTGSIVSIDGGLLGGLEHYGFEDIFAVKAG